MCRYVQRAQGRAGQACGTRETTLVYVLVLQPWLTLHTHGKKKQLLAAVSGLGQHAHLKVASLTRARLQDLVGSPRVSTFSSKRAGAHHGAVTP